MTRKKIIFKNKTKGRKKKTKVKKSLFNINGRISINNLRGRKKELLRLFGFTSIRNAFNVLGIERNNLTNEGLYRELINRYNQQLENEEEGVLEEKEEGVLEEKKEEVIVANEFNEVLGEFTTLEGDFRRVIENDEIITYNNENERVYFDEEGDLIVILNNISYKIKDTYTKEKFKTDLIDFLKRTPTYEDIDGVLINKQNPKIDIDIRFITTEDLINTLYDQLTNQLIRLYIGNTIYNLNNSTLERLKNINEDEHEYMSESDKEIINILLNRPVETITIELLFINKQRTNGGFFEYLVKNINLNLDDYGIHSEFINENYKENCLIRALRIGGLNNDIILRIIQSRYIKHRNIPQNKLSLICEEFKFNLDIKNINKNNKIFKYPKKQNKEYPTYKLGVIENHYFIINKTNYTSFYLENYDKIKNIKNKRLNHIFKYSNTEKTYKTNKAKTINSYKLISLLYKLKHLYLEPLNANKKMFLSIYYDKYDDLGEINTLEGDKFREVVLKENKFKYKTENVFTLDLETYADHENKHIPYLGVLRKGLKNSNGEYRSEEGFLSIDTLKGCGFEGEICGEDILTAVYNSVEDNIAENILIFVHNLKYDFTFICNVRGVRVLERIKTNGRLLMVKILYRDRIITFRDSLGLITAPLSKFGKMFNLNVEKEIMPYSLYNAETIKKRYINLNECMKCKDFIKTTHACKRNKIDYIKSFDSEKWEAFVDNAEKWKCLDNDRVDIIKYSMIYCKLDCKVLNDGLCVFRDSIKKLCDIDILDTLTISSIADKYFIKNDCYKDCYEISGISREWIQRCVVGGRCMLRNNKPIIKKNCEIIDLDANGLYQSSIIKLKGFLKGTPKIIEENWEEVKQSADYYFVCVKITKINISRKMPCLSYKDNNKRNFSNEVIGKELYLSKDDLEEAIKYMGVEYEFISGLYFNEGFNKNVIAIVQKLYTERRRYKKEGNPLEKIIKLLMNSCYGKTLQKAYENKESIIPIKKVVLKSNDRQVIVDYLMKKREENPKYKEYYSCALNPKYKTYYLTELTGQKYLDYNYQSIKSVNTDGNNYYVETYNSVGNHFNRCHIGNQILSMSKIIMNDLIYTCEDNNIKVYYQDTDSVHIDKKNLSNITNIYADREINIIGDGLGQFHPDYELEGVKDKSTIYSYNSAFLNKKTYINCLVGLNEEGKEVFGYHIRNKGIPTSSVYHYDNKNNINNPFKIYENIFNGEKVEFDLTNGGDNVCFKYIDNNVFFNNSFNRIVSL